MHQLRVIAAAIALAATSAATSSAQEAGQFGISMGYPGSIGVIWHITDAVAISPDLSFRRSVAADNKTTATGYGISALWYFAKDDALRMYVKPRFQYLRTSSEYEFAVLAIPTILTPQELAALGLNIDATPPTFKTSAASKSLSGSFGAQYALHKRFSVFGEAGLNYSKSGVPDTVYPGNLVLPTRREPPHSWGTTTSVGVIVYFRD